MDLAAVTFSSHDVIPTSPVPPTEQVARVSESYSTTLNCLIGGSPWDLFPGVDPLLLGPYCGFLPADRVQLPNHAPTGFFTELQHRAAISWSRWLCERNMLAIGFLRHVPAYIGPMTVQWVKKGHSPGSVSTGLVDRDGDGETDADPLVRSVQQVWDEWCQ